MCGNPHVTVNPNEGTSVKTILVVETIPYLFDVLRICQVSAHVVLARSVNQCHDLMASSLPDLVIIDHHPESPWYMDGRALAETLRTDPRMRDLPIVLLVDYPSQPADVSHCELVGTRPAAELAQLVSDMLGNN